MSNDEITAVFVFSKKTGFLKEIIPNTDNSDDVTKIEEAVKRILKPENGRWITQLFRRQGFTQRAER